MSNRRHDDDRTPERTLARDDFSVALREKGNHPGSVSKQSLVEVEDFYGQLVTWVVRTIRVESEDTVFLQRQDGQGAVRLVLPPEVTTVLARHRDGAATVNRRRAGRTQAAKRKAAGIAPAFLVKKTNATKMIARTLAERKGGER